MFQKISLSSNGFWIITDSDFKYFTYYKESQDLAWAVITAYRSKGYDVKDTIKNLQLYYRSVNKYTRATLLEKDNRNFKNYFSPYYPCLKRYVERLSFVGC